MKLSTFTIKATGKQTIGVASTANSWAISSSVKAAGIGEAAGCVGCSAGRVAAGAVGGPVGGDGID